MAGDWIDSAAHEVTPPVGNGFQSEFQHVLVMARADARREAADRVLAAGAVQRVGGAHADELLAILGLDDEPEPEHAPTMHPPRQEKRCRDCEVVKPATEFVRRTRHSDGLETYCKPCARIRKNAWRRRTARER